MGFLSGIFRSRDKPSDRTAGSSYSFFLGGTASGKYVTERSAIYFLLHDEPNTEMTSFIFRETLMTLQRALDSLRKKDLLEKIRSGKSEY